jgi:transcriptional regulator GlxA family with amidase domain
MNLLNADLKDFLPKLKFTIRSKQQSVESYPEVENMEIDKYQIQISDVEYLSATDFFLNNAISIVEQNIANKNFSTTDLAIQLGISKSTLQRKSKKMLKVSPGDFIKTIRLKHARMMVINNVGSVRQIALAVGFIDPKYFSRCFRKEFGMTPHDLKMLSGSYNDIQNNDFNKI